jgi:LacI family transcriptional regulator
VSCDDIPFAEFLTPPLSTVRIPLAETGRQAVELLLRAIGGEQVPEKTPLLPVQLIVRGSCGGQPAKPEARSRPLTKEAP